jgi:hypothetical protein
VSYSEEELKKSLPWAHHERMQELERQNISTWTEMAEIAILVRDNNEWSELGYHSWSDWLEHAVPQSASSVHAGIRVMETLDADIPREDQRLIPSGNAKVMAMLPEKMRRDPEIVGNAKRLKPKKFVAAIQKAHPGLHIEKLAPRKHSFTLTQSEVIDGAIAMYQVIEDKPEASAEEALEGMASQYILENQGEYERIKKYSKIGVHRTGTLHPRFQ